MDADRYDNFIKKKFDFLAKFNSADNEEIKKIARQGIVQQINEWTTSKDFNEQLICYIIEKSKEKLSELDVECENFKQIIDTLEKRKKNIVKAKEVEDKTERKQSNNLIKEKNMLEKSSCFDDFDLTKEELEELTNKSEVKLDKKIEPNKKTDKKKIEVPDHKKMKSESSDVKPKISRKRKSNTNI